MTVDTTPLPDELPPFDPTNACVKCGHVIKAPEAPVKVGPDGKTTVTGPAPEPPPPNVTFCYGYDCPWYDDVDETEYEEHMHAVCTVCGYEWLTKPADG